MTSSFGALSEFTCSQPFSAEVDHCSDTTTIMYCPDLMVRIHFRTLGLWPSSEIICSESFFVEVVSAKVDRCCRKIPLRIGECPLGS
jgi:hypothetical protein